ncbi:Hypothetical predicted protein [Olea europaea subsp. europaea]|uniref:Uncharacterized protein n=1 Tax=Olea europaea subsp. europaea TaxID=158383 RepID=A0A8S0UWP9_OLEEU|nr:Hypothetical predicted protein [Olea europaea subsp. europaea]
MASFVDYIFIIGGRLCLKGKLRPYVMTRSSAEVYDPQHDKWDFKAITWELDVPPYQIVDVNKKLYSSGDSFKLWKGYIEAYDEKQSIWNGVNESNLHCKSPNSTPDVK